MTREMRSPRRGRRACKTPPGTPPLAADPQTPTGAAPSGATEASKTTGPHRLLVRDGTYPNMWRIKLPGGELSDMVNLTRASEAARILDDDERKGRAPQ